MSDFDANWCTYGVIFGADFDFRIVKVVTLRDHEIGASEILAQGQTRLYVFPFFAQSRVLFIAKQFII